MPPVPSNNKRISAILSALLRQTDPLTRKSGQDEWLSASDITNQIGDSSNRSTIFRSLVELFEANLIEAVGGTKSRKYRLAINSRAYLNWDLSRPKDQRQKVHYDPSLLDSYEPNKTRWISQERARVLLEHGKAEFEIDEIAYRRVMNSLLIDLSYASSRLEDVSITWLDTKALIELGEMPEGLSDKELRIVMNHKDAIEYLISDRSNLDVKQLLVFELHKLLSDGLMGDPADSGRLRKKMVKFDDSAYIPITIPTVLGDEFRKFCKKAEVIENPFEQSVFILAFMSYLQPFADANKRTSRLAMNIPLLKNSLAPYSFVHTNRQEYMFGLLAFYERGNSSFIVDAFESGYLRSAPKYVETLEFIQEGGVLNTLSPIGKEGGHRI